LIYPEDLTVESVTLKFEIADEHLNNVLGIFTDHEEFEGIKRLNVFKWFDEINMSLPVETKFDIGNNILYTEVDRLGTFAIMDMEMWFEFLGVEPEEEEPEDEFVPMMAAFELIIAGNIFVDGISINQNPFNVLHNELEFTPTIQNISPLTSAFSPMSSNSGSTSGFYFNGPTTGQTVSSAFSGGVLAPNGKVIFVPLGSARVGIYDPETNTYTDGPVHGHGQGNNAFRNGVLAPNGNIILVPMNNPNIGIYNPVTNTYTNGPAHGRGREAFSSGVLTSDGKIILVPYGSGNIGIYDPVTNTYTNGPAHGQGYGAFRNGTLTPDGKIILIPFMSANIGIYDPATNTYTNGPAHGKGALPYWNGVLTPDGKVILIPYRSPSISIYDPITNTYSSLLAHGQGMLDFSDGILMSDGRIVLVPLTGPNIYIFNPMTNVFTVGPAHGLTANGSIFAGGVLIPNGNIVFVPSGVPNIGIFVPGSNSIIEPFSTIIGSSWRNIALDGPLSPTNNIDTDGDGLTDWEETFIDIILQIIGTDNLDDFRLPTLHETISYMEDLTDIISGINRYLSEMEENSFQPMSASSINMLSSTNTTTPTNAMNVIQSSLDKKILATISDPTDADSDGDGILDKYDLYINSPTNFCSESCKAENTRCDECNKRVWEVRTYLRSVMSPNIPTTIHADKRFDIVKTGLAMTITIDRLTAVYAHPFNRATLQILNQEDRVRVIQIVVKTGNHEPEYFLKIQTDDGNRRYIQYNENADYAFRIKPLIEEIPDWSWVFRRNTVVGDRFANEITQGYPNYIIKGVIGDKHDGFDITAGDNAQNIAKMRIQEYPVFSPVTGVVINVGYYDGNYPNKEAYIKGGSVNGYGNYVDIRSGNYIIRLAHLEFAPLVKQDDHVTPHTLLGIAGNTGWSSNYHLHIEVRRFGGLINPNEKFPELR
jgi:murein DD-endopeptidase MepM/ murein hydrolase activator NlpD